MFEGARRILLLIQILWGVGVVAVTWSESPYITTRFGVSTINALPVQMDEDSSCNIGSDAIEYLSRNTKSGKSVSVTLCFKPQKFDDGRMLIPFKVDSGGRLWGNAIYSDDVKRYTESYATKFELPSGLEKWVEDQWSRKRWRSVKEGALLLAGGWVCFWLLGIIIGWIVRGFAGIPSGKDTRPEN